LFGFQEGALLLSVPCHDFPNLFLCQPQVFQIFGHQQRDSAIQISLPDEWATVASTECWRCFLRESVQEFPSTAGCPCMPRRSPTSARRLLGGLRSAHGPDVLDILLRTPAPGVAPALAPLCTPVTSDA